jgi:hypothetical protein
MPRCLNCKSKFTPTYFLAKFCNDEKCLDASIKYARAKVKQNASKVWQKEKQSIKTALKTLTQLEAEAKKSFQKFIRLRDRDLNCISCGVKTTELWDGGHYKKAEIYSGVIFNEMNCHKQCRKCNRFLNGNELNYRLGLIARYGEQYANDIEQLANDTRQMKFTRDQLIAKKLQYDIKCKELLKLK